MDRRELLGWMVATGGLSALNRLSAHDLIAIGQDVHRSAEQGSVSASGALDQAALSAVTVAAEFIIPKSDTPGATDADVSSFIDRMLAGWYPAADRDRFRAGLRELDARSLARFQKSFVDASAADQLALLEVFDGDVSELRRTNAVTANEHWFAMLKYLTVWGYCTSEVGMQQTLHSWPMPMRYDGNALVTG